MALIIADRVKETSTTNGAGNITLSGAVTGFQSFSSAIGIGNTCYYVIEDPGAGEWEVGIGTINDATTLVRTTVLKSSNSNSVVTFTSGTKNVFVSFPADQIADLATLDGIESLTNKTLSTNTTWNGNVITGQYGGTGVANTGKTITIGGNLTTSGAFTTTIASTANTSVTLPTTGTLATLAGSETFTNKTLSTNTTWNGNIVTGQYGGTGVANTGKTITIGGNLTTSGSFTTTITSTANTSVTLPTTGTLATLAGSETLTNKTLSTNVDYNGNVVVGQYGGTGVANTGKTITIGGNLTTSGAFTTTLTATANTSITLPTAGTLATLAGPETLTNKTLSTNTTWNGNIVTGQYGGTGVANTGKTITIGGNLTTSGSFDTSITITAGTSITLPTAGTLATLAGSETLTNKTLSTNTTWNGNVIPGQYGGTGVANTGKTITIGGNLTTSGAFTTTLTSTANTSVTLPTTGTLATLTGTESLSNKYITTGAGNTTVAGLILTSGSNTTAVANGSIEFDNTNYYFSFAGSRKVNAYLDSNLTGSWSGTTIAGQYGGTGVANTGKTITVGGNLTTSGAFTTTLTATANTSVTLPTTGTLSTLAGIESFTNKTMSTNTTWNGNVIPGQYGGTGIANTGFTLTMAGNISHAGAFAQTFTATGTTSVTLPTAGTLSTLAGIESFTNKTLSTNTTWNGNVIAGQYGGTGVANTGKTITIGGNLTTSGAFTTTLTATADTSVTLPTTGILATLAGIESFTNKTLSTNTTWNGNVITGQYGGTGVTNTGKTITIGGNLTTSGAFTTTLTTTADTSVTLPTTGTLATLSDVESLNEKIESTAGAAWLWGLGVYGELGDDSTSSKSSPVQTVTGGVNWKQASCGWNDTAAIKTDGTLWLWGRNSYGELGDNSIVNKSSPVQTVTGGVNWKQVSVGRSASYLSHTAAVKTDGTLWLWGGNYYGPLGDNTLTDKSSPVQTITSGTNWKQVSCGFQYTAAIKTDGTLWTWGRNDNGQLGDNTTGDKLSPVQTTAGGVNWQQVSCGYSHTAAIKTDGTLWLWGYNFFGSLGDNTSTRKSSPVQTIAGGSNWSQVSCGNIFTAAIKTDGTLWTWGSNSAGQLGDNNSSSRSSPVQTVTGGNTWARISSGDSSSAAIKTDGSLWTWGSNSYPSNGALGDNTEVNRSSPVQTITGGYRWTSVSIGKHTFAIAADIISGDQGGTGVANTDKTITIGGNFTTSGAFTTTLTSTANTSVTLPTTGTLSTVAGGETITNKIFSTNTTWNGNVIPGQYGGTGIANTGKTITIGGNFTTSGAFTTTLTATATTSVTLPTTGTLATLAGIESFTNKTMSTNTTWNGNVIPGQYGGTGIANTGRTITIGGNFTTSGAFTTTLTSTANTSVTLPTTGTLATLVGTETFSNKIVNLAAGNATTAPLKFVTGTNMTTAAAGNMEFNGTRLFFTPSTTRQTVAFLTDITGGLTVADDTSTAATRYLIFTNATSGSVSTANTSSSKLFFNPATGDLTAGGSITALSDRTLKNNITTITGAVDKVNSLRGVEFDWVDSGDHSVGVIAQEVEDVIPEVVLTHKGLKSVAYGNLIAVLIEAIKDQDKRIKLLEALVERFLK